MITLVRIEKGIFNPPEIIINNGDTVQWINEDAQHDHNVNEAYDLFDSGIIKFRDNFSYTFLMVGDYTYNCSACLMKGKVHVK
jgi:plastocyanin